MDIFSIGDIDTSFHNSKIEYISFSPGESNFYVKLNQIRIGKEIIPINNYSVDIRIKKRYYEMG